MIKEPPCDYDICRNDDCRNIYLMNLYQRYISFSSPEIIRCSKVKND